MRRVRRALAAAKKAPGADGEEFFCSIRKFSAKRRYFAEQPFIDACLKKCPRGEIGRNERLVLST
jgi:hypothetical protein